MKCLLLFFNEKLLSQRVNIDLFGECKDVSSNSLHSAHEISGIQLEEVIHMEAQHGGVRLYLGKKMYLKLL